MENVVNFSKKDVFWQKYRKIFKNPKFYLRDFLIYFDLIREYDNVDDLISKWVIKLFHWLFSVVISGLLINLPLTLIFKIEWKWFTIVSYGLLSFIITKTWRGYVNGKKEISRAGK